MRSLVQLSAVFFGAGCGGVLRHAANRAAALVALGSGSSTLWVNVTGSVAMGLIAGWFAHRGQSGQTARLFLSTGVLGGYTTFSAFSLNVALLWERGQLWSSSLYVAGSGLLSVGGVFVGLAAIRQLPGLIGSLLLRI
jgi:fluoride exporter